VIAIRASLFARVLFWSFLNLAAVGSVLAGFFALQFRFGPDSVLFAGNRLQYVAARVVADLEDATAEQRTTVLEHYSATYHVTFALFDGTGAQLAGATVALPSVVSDDVRAAATMGGRGQFPPLGGAMMGGPGPGGPRGGPGDRGVPPPDGRPPGARLPGDRQPGDLARAGRMRPVQSMFQHRTSSPTQYWVGLRVPLFQPGERRPTIAALLVVSDSLTGHGLFFDVRPWLLVAAAILLVSIAIWFPFVRSLTSSIAQMTAAAEEMARGRFDVRIDARRSDEVGRLGVSINQLSTRLANFVGGQKRFLGDISHELNTPLARLDVALGIVEEKVGEGDRATVADAQEEVRLMSQLVSELLAFAKAGMEGQQVRLSPVPLARLCGMVVAREAQGQDVRVEVAPDAVVTAHPQLLARALANLVRNAVRYAGAAGPIVVASRAVADEVLITVSDRGPGVPADALPRLFEPFFRIEADRDRTTGGTGLGLAIVKTCVDACGGRVTARNLSPGFEVEVRLRQES
jgi:two-component system, OmpR family, sensor histidine kinase CpxA